jgi:hypothetical protein
MILEHGKSGKEMKLHLATEGAKSLRTAIGKLWASPEIPPPDSGNLTGVDEDAGKVMLLDLLFDESILPSYAFPTNLCSFVIQQEDGRGGVNVLERPQLAKSQALSEYAPGRLLVINKETYRVGGIFLDGPPTAAQAAPLFVKPLDRYVGCTRCTFVRIERAGEQQTCGDAQCPVCGSELLSRDLLDPPGFSPEDGRPVREGDREQEFSYATSAQLPELSEAYVFDWLEGAGTNLRHASGEDIKLIVTNKGQDGRGFCVCGQCGRAWLKEDDAGPPQNGHLRPFLLPRYLRQREGIVGKCNGNLNSDIFLGYEFRTDILLLRIEFRAPFDFGPTKPWLYDALATLAEALALGASRHLDIDPGEISAGFRFLSDVAEGVGSAEVFLYDTSSGGAGYSAEVGAELGSVLESTEEALRDCPGNCMRSCGKCLRHYGNRFLHDRLDRRLALDLLQYARLGRMPVPARPDVQLQTLAPLARYLELEGLSVQPSGIPTAPLIVTTLSGEGILLGTHPALLRTDEAERIHVLAAGRGRRYVLLPDYLVEQDIPSACNQFMERSSVIADGVSTRRQAEPEGAGSTVRVISLRGYRNPLTEFPIANWESLMKGSLVGDGTVQLPITVPDSTRSFAIRVPGMAGSFPEKWLIIRKFEAGDEDENTFLLIHRAAGDFKATGDAWTVAKVRRMEDGKVQVSYSRTEERFRPERIPGSFVSILATVVAHFPGE